MSENKSENKTEMPAGQKTCMIIGAVFLIVLFQILGIGGMLGGAIGGGGGALLGAGFYYLFTPRKS